MTGQEKDWTLGGTENESVEWRKGRRLATSQALVRPRGAARESAKTTVRSALDRKALVDAMQDAWNEFVADTGCFPDCFEWRGGNGVLFADFARGNFAQYVAERYRPSSPENVEEAT